MAENASSLRTNRLAMGVGAAVTALGLVAGLRGINSVGTGVGPDPFMDKSVYFPEDLGNIGHWIEFTAHNTGGALGSDMISNAFSSAGLSDVNVSSFLGNTVAGGTIRLPMTSNLSTDYNPTYSAADLGQVAGSILKPFDRQIYGNNDIPGAAALGAGMAGAAAGLGTALAGAAGAVADASKSEVAAAALKVGLGLAQNPHKIVLFTGVDFRDHSFSWRLSPRNKRESEKIKQIIDMFIYYSHPEYTFGGLFFKYPEFFTITFRSPKYLFTIRPSVCTDIRVNYHTQGYPAYIRPDSDDPAPAEVELSLSFKETEIVTKQSLNRSGVL